MVFVWGILFFVAVALIIILVIVLTTKNSEMVSGIVPKFQFISSTPSFFVSTLNKEGYASEAGDSFWLADSSGTTLEVMSYRPNGLNLLNISRKSYTTVTAANIPLVVYRYREYTYIPYAQDGATAHLLIAPDTGAPTDFTATMELNGANTFIFNGSFFVLFFDGGEYVIRRYSLNNPIAPVLTTTWSTGITTMSSRLFLQSPTIFGIGNVIFKSTRFEGMLAEINFPSGSEVFRNGQYVPFIDTDELFISLINQETNEIIQTRKVDFSLPSASDWDVKVVNNARYPVYIVVTISSRTLQKAVILSVNVQTNEIVNSETLQNTLQFLIPDENRIIALNKESDQIYLTSGQIIWDVVSNGPKNNGNFIFNFDTHIEPIDLTFDGNPFDFTVPLQSNVVLPMAKWNGAERKSSCVIMSTNKLTNLVYSRTVLDVDYDNVGVIDPFLRTSFITDPTLLPSDPTVLVSSTGFDSEGFDTTTEDDLTILPFRTGVRADGTPTEDDNGYAVTINQIPTIVSDQVQTTFGGVIPGQTLDKLESVAAIYTFDPSDILNDDPDKSIMSIYVDGKVFNARTLPSISLPIPNRSQNFVQAGCVVHSENDQDFVSGTFPQKYGVTLVYPVSTGTLTVEIFEDGTGTTTNRGGGQIPANDSFFLYNSPPIPYLSSYSTRPRYYMSARNLDSIFGVVTYFSFIDNTSSVPVLPRSSPTQPPVEMTIGYFAYDSFFIPGNDTTLGETQYPIPHGDMQSIYIDNLQQIFVSCIAGNPASVRVFRLVRDLPRGQNLFMINSFAITDNDLLGTTPEPNSQPQIPTNITIPGILGFDSSTSTLFIHSIHTLTSGNRFLPYNQWTYRRWKLDLSNYIQPI